MFRRLGEVLRGERSLGETYWLWFILPHVPILATIMLLSVNSMTIIEHQGARVFYLVLHGSLLLSLAITLLSGFAVMQSAFKRAQSTFWAAIAILVVSGNIIFGGVRTPALILGTYRLTDYERNQSIVLINSQLPRKMNGFMTLVHVDISGTTATYSITVDPAYANRLAATSLRVAMRPKVCELLRGKLKVLGITKIDYKYSSDSVELFAIEFTPQDCT